MRKILTMVLAIVAGSAGGGERVNRFGSMAESILDMMDAFTSAYQKRQAGNNPYGFNPNQWSQPWSQFGQPWSAGANPWAFSGLPMSQGISPWNLYGNPINQQPMPWGMNGTVWPQQQPQSPAGNWNAPGPGNTGNGASSYWRPSITARLDGEWEGASGEHLAIDNGRFRLYMSRDNYRDGLIRLLGDMLYMRDPASGTTRQYEFAEQDGKLALRDSAGNLLLYRRISRRVFLPPMPGTIPQPDFPEQLPEPYAPTVPPAAEPATASRPETPPAPPAAPSQSSPAASKPVPQSGHGQPPAAPSLSQ